MSDFIHLRVQSSYSMLESSLKIEQIVDLSIKHKMPAVALCDRNNLFASLEFALTACKYGVQPINGALLDVFYEKDDLTLSGQFLFLAADQSGYKNLLKLVSQLYIVKNSKYPLCLSLSDVKEFNEGLIVLSGYSEGIIGKLLLANQKEQAQDYLQELVSIFQDRFYMEIMRHGLIKENNIEKPYIELALENNIPLVATNNVLFPTEDMYDAHDVLLCIAEGKRREETNRKIVSEDCYFKSPEEMKKLFKDLPSAIKNTVTIAQRCHVMAETSEPMLPNFTTLNINESEELRYKAKNGLEERLKNKIELESTLKPFNIDEIEKLREKYFLRLEYELEVICSMNFAGYFLIVSDFIKWSKANNIPVGPGRGSGAGSIVAWSLLITDLDPIRFGLLFERFLNPERISMPDFDIDFCQERREEVINYVRQKYGNERVAQIITFGKLQAKAVIKDVARALSLGYYLADRISKLVPFNAINPVTLEQAIAEVPELNKAAKGDGLYDDNISDNDKEIIKNVIDTALKLEGLHRHASIHAAGIVISGKNLIEVVPLYREENSEMFVIQYSMKYAELAGLVKFDFLGLKTLTVIDKCINLIRAQGMKVALNTINFKDFPTYEMLSQGASVGVFQFESPGMKESLRKLKPDCIEDIMALGALYRPGPMDNIPTYIACKHNKQEPDYLHPLLEDILRETYGVIIYQEQVIEIAKTLAGYSLGAADLLRRAMGKKIKSEMDAQQELFIEGAKKNNVSKEQATSIFAAVEKFAGYGFNKSHAAAYAVISYHTAFLRANFPVEFIVASLNLEISDSNKINVFINEAKKMKIQVLAPDINSSKSLFSICKDQEGNKAIAFALGGLKNITPDTANSIVEIREQGGVYKSIFEFVERMPEKEINRRILENLITAGAFDKLNNNRNQLCSSINAIIEYMQSYNHDKIVNQMNLFDNTTERDAKYPELFKVNEFTLDEKALKEFKAIGFFLSYHPLDGYNLFLEKINVITSTFLHEDLNEGIHYLKIAGVIHEKDTKMSSKGRFIILKLSDQYGIYEATIFNEDILRKCASLLEVKDSKEDATERKPNYFEIKNPHDEKAKNEQKDEKAKNEKTSSEPRLPLVLTCEIRKDEGGVRIAVIDIEDLREIVRRYKSEYKITITKESKLEELLVMLNRLKNVDGNTEINLVFNVADSFVAKSRLPDKFFLLPKDIEAIKDKKVYVEEVGA